MIRNIFILFPLLLISTDAFLSTSTHPRQLTLWGSKTSPKLHYPTLFSSEDATAAELEAEKIVRQLESNSESSIPTDLSFAPPDEFKYQPSLKPNDPIIAALTQILKSPPIQSFDLLDSRWNGNEVFQYTSHDSATNTTKHYFVKINRVEHPSVMTSEAVSLTALHKTETIQVPKPLHIGRLPKVGTTGPGSFIILEWMDLKPFASMRPDVQTELGSQLADLHLSKTHDALHKGRFGFPVNNYLAITPLNNTWCDSWEELFGRRLTDQLMALHVDKVYGRRALPGNESLILSCGKIIVRNLNQFLDDVEDEIRPSLIHGDLWIGNTGAILHPTVTPVVFDPACCFAHSEFELAISHMFGGYTDHFWDAYHAKIPKAKGFEKRAKLYAFYHYLNQLNIFGDGEVKKTCEEMSLDLMNMIEEEKSGES